MNEYAQIVEAIQKAKTVNRNQQMILPHKDYARTKFNRLCRNPEPLTRYRLG